MTLLFESKSLKMLILLCFISMVSAFPSSTDENNDCSNYCQNDGICVVIKNQRQCYCLPKWQGQLCEDPREYRPIQIDPSRRDQISSARTPACSLIPADFCNGGVCQFNGTLFSCACQPDRAGPNCERPSPCINYCLNGALCSLKDEFTPECPNCTAEFSGKRCEIMKTTVPTTTIPTTTIPTTLDPICVALQPHCGVGTCVIDNGKARCQCPPTHTGTLCQTQTGVTSGPGPVNTPTGNSPTVNPPTVSSGTVNPGTVNPGTVNPESGTDNACSSNPCLNGRPCYNNGNSFYCFCGNSYTGLRCETSIG